MNIALIGYGKMGRTIEALGKEQGHAFPLIIDLENSTDLSQENLAGVDVAIEFTSPDSAPGNIITCIDYQIPVVSGSTGWNERFGEVERYCISKAGAFFYASNFSIGVNILFSMNRQLAQIMNQFQDYSVSMKEVHHIHKVDAPSGTAITLAEQIMDEHDRIARWSLPEAEDNTDPDGAEGQDNLVIEAIREGEVKGKHSIQYESNVDSITLSHHAKSRDAFASGVFLAADFIKGKTGVFGMKDLLRF